MGNFRGIYMQWKNLGEYLGFSYQFSGDFEKNETATLATEFVFEGQWEKKIHTIFYSRLALSRITRNNLDNNAYYYNCSECVSFGWPTQYRTWYAWALSLQIIHTQSSSILLWKVEFEQRSKCGMSKISLIILCR